MPRVGSVGEMQSVQKFCEHVMTGEISLMDYEACPICEGGKKIIRRCGRCGAEFTGGNYCVHMN